MSAIPHTEFIDIGRTVHCDICDVDWTDRPESGGFLFTSYAYCPDCAKATLDTIKANDEGHFIKAHCPPDQSYADWVRSLRGGRDYIRIDTHVEE